ncbi:SDR family NAD(P)-dependent oxidoreductase [Actinobaculum sp. 352]|uniref:SDR family NAD(P)-dependent oxidoreductase n=1 Tax=Actinobaculum sp. 352 TaxID=2490946 RepID=UPI000F7D6A33|nr:SDR family NAD(P)-dependent oxidoreductase [Actinobaculum sp. 352]RTE50801.1 SDR family NAD(P)-dependent oxidoreductase [Actinobaculum sp. 352]
MSRIFITGSTQELGRNAAAELLDADHDVVVHARTAKRARSLTDLMDRGADVVGGDFAELEEVTRLADDVNRLGQMDAVIHNAGIIDGRALLPVNVVAPYVLTALIDRPERLVCRSSGMHTGGRADLSGIDWSDTRATRTYSDTKLLVTALASYVARMWPEVLANAVRPGWVPTRMGSQDATDDLRLGHVTQVWLTTSDMPSAQVTGEYWFHQEILEPHPATRDTAFQEQLVDALATYSGVPLG